MTTSAPAIAAFRRDRLEALAARFREEEARSALTVAESASVDPGRQPKLSFKRFTVSQVQAAVSPDCSFRLLIGALENARHTITAYVYNIGAPYLLAVLAKKHSEGVKIRVMVDPNDPSDRKSREFENLKKLGIDVRLSPSSPARRVFSVCHQKFAVVDGMVTVVESANWAESAIPVVKQVGEYRPGNREWLIRVDDKAVAAWFEDLFQKDSDIPAKPGPRADAEPQVLTTVLEAAARFTPPGKLFDIEAATKPVTLLPVISPVNYLAEVGKALKKAKRRIWIQQQYIIAGQGVNELLEIVHERAATCDVRIVVSPKFTSSWQSSLDTLRAAGLLRTLRAQNLEHVIHCHNKGLVIDDDQVVVSSTNWSENSILRAREAGFLVGSRQIAGYFASVFEIDWKEGISPQRIGAHTVALSPGEMV